MKKYLSLVALLLALVFAVSACVTPEVPELQTPSDGTPSDGGETTRDPANDVVLDIGSDRQVFWDTYIVDTDLTTAVLTLNSPTQEEIVFVFDAPWEGNSCDYHSIVKIPQEDGTVLYRMYYNGWDSGRFEGTKDIRICAIESTDGLNWYRPNYGLYEFDGIKETNIVWMTDYGFDNFFVFYDTNPDCPEDQRFKAVGSYLHPSDYGNLHGFTSADGLVWTDHFQLKNGADGTFDSVNTGFYNPRDGKYYIYFRGFHGTVRDIRTSSFVAFDMLYLGKTTPLTFEDGYDFALYTNNVQLYYRAPQVFVGFPTRYNDHGNVWTENMDYLPDYEERHGRYPGNPRYATTVTDAMFMTSRDGVNFDRFTSAWATPGAEHTGNWVYGDCYFAYGMIETPAEYPDQANELSMYAFEGKWKEGASRLYRYSNRIDGFACYKAPSYEESIVTTKAFTFEGEQLLLNFATSGAGSIVINVLDKDGNPIEGYTSYTIFGDQVDRPITFGTKSLADLQGQEIRLEFKMRDAEIYSFIIE